MEHKVALVTGAGSGRAVAGWYAKEGGQVLVSDIQEPGGRETVKAILGQRCL